MPTPTRPVAGANVDDEWGQLVHDFSFAPAGCIVDGTGVTMLTANAYRDLPIDGPIDDPGGYLDAGNLRVEVPADGEGLYLVVVRARTLNGAAGDESGVVLRLNGTEVARSQVGQEGSTAVPIGITYIETLSAGDQLSLRARQIGSGARAGITLQALTLIRLGYEMGAPA